MGAHVAVVDFAIVADGANHVKGPIVGELEFTSVTLCYAEEALYRAFLAGEFGIDIGLHSRRSGRIARVGVRVFGAAFGGVYGACEICYLLSRLGL